MSTNRGYQAILDILGPQCAIIPIGDPAHENAARTTVTTVGNGNGNGLVFTYPEPITAFDLPPIYQRTPFRIPIVRWNGSDEYATSPDATFWSRNDASGEAVTQGVWGIVTDTSGVQSLMTKWDSSTAEQEWQWTIRSDEAIRLTLRDDSVPTEPFRNSDAPVTQGRLTFFTVTYDGGGGTTAADGITFYENGIAVASTATNQGTYVAMQNGTDVVALGVVNSGGTPANFFNGRMLGGVLGPASTQRELTAAQVRNWYHLGLQCQKASFPLGRRRGR